MTWEWSHTAEAYQDAFKNLSAMARNTREVIYAEWLAKRPGHDLSKWWYRRGLQRARKLPDGILTQEIWDRMEEQANCDNGGHNAYCCPYGCGCHTVSFSCETAEE